MHAYDLHLVYSFYSNYPFALTRWFPRSNLKFCPIQEDSLITVMLFAFTDNLVQTFEFASKANKLTKEKWIRKK